VGTKSSKQKGGNKKHGRNKVKCARYRKEGRREKNKARRIARHERCLEKARQKKESALSE
jgi:hypothetical protein